jgi:AAA domain
MMIVQSDYPDEQREKASTTVGSSTKRNPVAVAGVCALGEITDLCGDPAQGKSRVSYDLITRVTTGQPMPNSTTSSPPAGVILLQAEDSVGATVKPTLKAAGADIDRVFVYDPGKFKGKPLTLPDDMDLVKDAVNTVKAKLLVIDPTAAFFDCNPSSGQSVRKALRPLVELAESKNLAVLLISHMNKGNNGNPLYRASGSIQWVATVRSALRVIGDPVSTDLHAHILVQVKTNLPSAPSLSYRTVMVQGNIQVEWLGTSSFAARDLSDANDDQSRLYEGMEILYLILRNGPRISREVYEKAKEEGAARRTIERAKKALRVKSGRKKSSHYWWWEWRLPDEENEILTHLHQKYDALDDATNNATITVETA